MEMETTRKQYNSNETADIDIYTTILKLIDEIEN
jgi:hypothetical protein